MRQRLRERSNKGRLCRPHHEQARGIIALLQQEADRDYDNYLWLLNDDGEGGIFLQTLIDKGFRVSSPGSA